MRVFIKFVFLFFAFITLSLLGATSGIFETTVDAEGEPPIRQTEIVVSFTEHLWWLTRWESNQVECSVPIDHKGLPSSLEVLQACGEELFEEWISTPACKAKLNRKNSTRSCEGLYLFLADVRPGERVVTIDLPVPTIWLSLSGCVPTPPQNKCSEIPSLQFSAEEPLPNEIISAIHVRIGDRLFDCLGDSCTIPMKATNIRGIDIEFWADSSFGDESEHFAGRTRIVDGGVSDVPGEKIWFVDVISSQWRGNIEISSCGAAWEAFPPLGGPPLWLSSPEDPAQLSTDTPFAFLAGQIIARGLVDTSNCPQDGLLANGAANACGAQLARNLVEDWQNQFDTTILDVAEETSIPAQLLKNLFAQESQFWPGEIIPDEFGLGQLTSQGADSPLLWNPSFYRQFCPLVLHTSTCEEGYAKLDDEYQAMLRGALAILTNANCPNCEQGIDFAHADNSIKLFAQTLLGNCEQVSYIVFDVTGEVPGLVSSYEDLWRYTLVNYNAGPGCLITALQTAWRREQTLDWNTVSQHISTGCANAITYVNRVTRERAFDEPDFLATPLQVPKITTSPRTSPLPTTTPTTRPYPIFTLTPYPIFTLTPYPGFTPFPLSSPSPYP
jgi:hypothetical protein